MSSGQWEVVGKGKKSQSGKTKTTKDDEKKPTKNGPKLEDIVPHSQIKSYYEGMEIDDTKKPLKEKKNGDKKKKQDKKSEPSKPKPPKTLEEAFEAIDTSELANIITTNKLRFSNAPLVWLKEVATFINSKTQIDVEDPTFSSYDLKYPLSVVPNDVKNLLEKVLQDAGKANTQLFFDVTLTALANDMSRGQLVNGHRLLLQMLASEYPEFCIASIPKSSSLRNSYQNRPPIGLSLLWAFGQGGTNNFAVGLKVWQELFLPIIELKNYSKYIIVYLSKLLDRHGKMDAKVSQDQLLAMFDMVNNKKNNLPKDQSSDLMKQLLKYKDIYFNKSGNKLQVTFNQLMKKLPNQYLSGISLDPYNKAIVESLVNCLQRDDSCNATWRQLFNRCSKQSATLIEYIDTNWEEVSPKLKKKSLKATVLQFKEVCGETLKGKKKDETVVKASKICQMPLSSAERCRKYREKLKQENPEKFEEMKKKNLERTKANKRKISDMSENEKQDVRKKWREAKRKNHNENKSLVNETERARRRYRSQVGREKVSNQDIENIVIANPETILPIPATMTIHQVIVTKKKNTVKYRPLSCFCRRGICDCFSTKIHTLIKENNEKQTRVRRFNEKNIDLDSSCEDTDTEIEYAESDQSDWVEAEYFAINDGERMLQTEKYSVMQEGTGSKAKKKGNSEVKILADVKNTPENRRYFNLKTYGKLTEIGLNFDISLGKKSLPSSQSDKENHESIYLKPTPSGSGVNSVIKQEANL